jgi:hypothetical protein
MSGTERKSTMNFRTLALLTLVSSIVLPYAASQTAAPTLAASALTAVPPLIPYSGQVEGRTGRASASFLIYKDQQGGEPLFIESQIIGFDQAGHYKVQLGAANPNGLPSDLFATGEARWLEVQVAGEAAQPRILLASVPYALKAADAATLGGFPASAFVLAGSRPAALESAVPTAITPDATSNVTTPGGKSGYLPMFTGTASIADSIVFQNSLGIGIGDVPNGALDVNGKSIFRGPLQVARIGNATTAQGVDSNPFSFFAQAYSSSKKANVGPFFSLQAEPTGNNTSSPGATLNLLYNNGLSSANSETGFYFNTDGTIHFASNQVFQISSSTNTPLVGISGEGSGVQGSSASAYEGSAGVVGSDSNDEGRGIGVLGDNDDANSSTFQVFKSLNVGAGVWGDSSYPTSFSNTWAVIGTADDQYAGVFENNSLTAFTLTGTNNVSNPLAPALDVGGNFGQCTVDTSGDLMCTGSKSAVVPVDNNTRKVALYAVESPENWFEDFGSGQLSNGVATVNLEPVFAQTVNLDIDYHVFLTPRGDSKGLYVSRTTPTSFEVRESGSGRSTLAFDYRIVARRKSYETVRLADKTREQLRAKTPLMMQAQRAKQSKQ